MAAIHTLPEIDGTWPQNKKLIAALQIFSNRLLADDIEVDGLWGPQTEASTDMLESFQKSGIKPENWRPDEERNPGNPNNWPKQTEAELTAFFGVPGTGNLVWVNLPYAHRLSWETDHVINKFQANRKVKDSLERVLAKVLAHYGIEEIKRLRLDIWGGCYNLRKKRGGTSLSTHSWGIALDYDPERNQLKWGADRATFARPEYDAWWRFWEEEGWVSLGQERNFDWMHVQAAKL